MFEIKHLKTLATLAETGNIRKAAEQLFVTQSALSHQLKDLEQRLNTSLFIRNTSPVKFTTSGEVLLALADNILPKVNDAISELTGRNKVNSQLNLAIDCHACFQWLLPLTEQFSQLNPDLNIEFIEQDFARHNTPNPERSIDILFTDEKVENDGFNYHALGRFEVVAVVAKHKFEDKLFLDAGDFSEQVLLTYPVKTQQLDIFKLFLNKQVSNNATVQKPKLIKQVANSHMILQMVAANMGITTLPDWLVNSLTKQSLVKTKRIGESGIYKTLYARYQSQHPLISIIEQLIPQTVAAFNNLYQTQGFEKRVKKQHVATSRH
ncbi:MAG: LysR substrate-binding domain-containing protein [Colwellia sp.]|nr:LysR substrate-binding domain-containing protein [Colwellia sp.]MCW8865282.1 LysR substrate-binding domain-containing protein [Colwellia sp.]MCW9082710.1 LysR substrate-binding domain-containing protein [Colwellia sp.]